MRRLFALMAALFLVAPALRASAFVLNPELDVSQYAHTSWKIRDGFVKGEIDAIAQTPDGYLWLGTEFGLYRFDGIRAVPWQPPGEQKMVRSWVRSLLVSRDGTLWIGGSNGLASFRNGKLTEYRELANFYVFALLEDHEGSVWVGAGGVPIGNLCRIRNGSVQCYGADGKFGRFVGGLFEDRAGNIWAGVRDGLWKWKPGTPQYYPLAGQPDGIKPLNVDADGALLFGWKEKIYRFADGKAEVYPLPVNSPSFWAGGMLRDRDGALWIATKEGILRIRQGKLDSFSMIDGLSGENVKTIFKDREGNIWTSTTEGLDCFHDVAVPRLTVKQGLSNNAVGSILADRDGSVWLATFGGLDRLDHGVITAFTKSDGSWGGKQNLGIPNSLFQDEQGRIWFGTPRGLDRLEKGRVSSIEGVPGGNFLSIAQDTAGNVWALNENAGLYRISPRNKVETISWAALGHEDHPSVLSTDQRQGGLWLGFFRGGISYFSDGQVGKSYTTSDGLGSGHVSDFLFDHEGILWVSTESGLSRLKNDRFATLTSKNGLPCDTVHWAVEDNDRSMWLYTACGLVRIARSELDGWVASLDKERNTPVTVKVTVFDIADGVRSLAIAGHYHPQVAKTSDGRIWFLPLDGVSVIDPRHLAFNSIPPPVHVEKSIADRKAYDVASDANGKAQLAPHVRDLEIDYSALSFVAPEKNLFRYKLEGYDRDWQDVGNRRQAFYTNLPPRSYRFRVIACNNSGVWNETGDSFDFSIAPAYYQTIWFKILCVAAFLALLWALYLLRLQQLRHQFNIGLEARVNERTRVARELHDTLLQSFQGAVFQFQAARKLLLRNADNAMQVIDEAIQAAEEGITEGRAAIHDLRPEPAVQRDLPELLNAAGHESSTAREPEGHPPIFSVIVEGKQQTLPSMLQDEVYRISREVIRNAFAHAVASRIEVEIRYDKDRLRVRVRDDGKGIDPKILSTGGQPGHWGISGMRERAQRIGSRLDFWSEMGAGTEVQLTVPAAMAYEKRRANRRFRLLHRAGSDE